LPVKNKLPQWERMENRTKLFTTILQNSLTFTELLNETGFSRATLTNHLKDLRQDGIIEKTIENNRVVYSITLDENRLESEIKKIGFDILFDFVYEEHPKVAFYVEDTYDSFGCALIALKRIYTCHYMYKDPLYMDADQLLILGIFHPYS
jgi:DNA-binding transcriptional ArsR family regulator